MRYLAIRTLLRLAEGIEGDPPVRSYSALVAAHERHQVIFGFESDDNPVSWLRIVTDIALDSPDIDGAQRNSSRQQIALTSARPRVFLGASQVPEAM